MFGNSKPFGTASTFGGSSFGNTSTPFGQSTNTFGAKPATNNVFGSSSFGVSTPSAPMSGGLFGSTTPATGTGLFGQPSTAFGAPAATSTSGFGFGSTSSTGGLFGTTTPSTQNSGGLFGNTSSSAFGTPRPTFGGFGASTTPGTGLFGQTATTGTSLFGSSGGFGTTAPTGTTVKFNAPTGTDTMMKGGVSQSIGTRHQCITCMKEYENKSLEELRVEDYAANRKGGSATSMGFGAPTQQTGLFGQPAASSSAFSFGATTQAKPLFGGATGTTTNTFGSGSLFGQPAQTQNTVLFGKSVGFGAPATSTGSVFNFGGSTGTSLFGQNNQQKPLFGQTTGGTGLFGSTATTQSTGFGTNTAFGGFGATSQPSTGLFGAKPTGFGTTSTTTTNTFSFGNTNNMSGGGGLFGQKPAAPAFGTGTAFGTQSTGFGSFGTTPVGGTGLFGQTKPATSGFGNTGGMFGGGFGSSFGTSTFSSGLGANTGTGLFGNTANKAPGFSFGNTGSTGFNFGATNPSTSTFSFGQNTAMPASDPNNNAALQQAQQQILAMTSNPFGDSPLFRNPIKDTSREAEILKPTNPSAQKALLNDNHYKIVPLPSVKIKPKPWSPVPSGKMLLFDGLEDEEPSLGSAVFLPKKSVKKLVLKSISGSQSSVTLHSSVTQNQSTRIDVSISLKSPAQSVDHSSTGDSSRVIPLTVDVTNNDTSMQEFRNQNVEQRPNSQEKALPPTVTSNFRQNFNTSMNDSFAALHTNKPPPSRTYRVWSDTEDSVTENDASGEIAAPAPEEPVSSISRDKHPTGITLTDSSYYTIPTLDDMIPLVDNEKNSCLVRDITIGRHGYGRVTFPGYTNVYGLNIDDIVIFGKKEINVYPDDDNKPPIGEGLNRNAKVILENVWPLDKTSHTLIQDPDRINKMGYSEKIQKCTHQLGAIFIDYKPETGLWAFEVDHFSKYGLEDSDDEMDTSKQPEKKISDTVPKAPMEHLNGKSNSPDSVQTSQTLEFKRRPIGSFQHQEQEMDTHGSFNSQFMSYPLGFIQEEELMGDITSPTNPILTSNIDAERIQGMKASFFDDMDEENWSPVCYKPQNFLPPKKDTGYEDMSPSIVKNSKLSNGISKKKKYLDHTVDDYSYVLLKNSVQHSELGLQNSLSSLSLSVNKLPEWLSAFPIVKGSSEKTFSTKPTQVTLNKMFLKPFESSVLYNKQHLLCDAGYFMGRSFRVGWTADGVVAFPAPPQSKAMESYQKILYDIQKTPGRISHCRSSFSVTLQQITSISSPENDYSNQEKLLIDALELQLKNSASTAEGTAPLFVPKPGVDPIHDHASLFENLLKETDLSTQIAFIQQCAFVWDLLVSLWGKIRGVDDDQTISNYAAQIARREALSNWLIKTTEDDIAKRISSLSKKEDYLIQIFLYLNGRRTSDAVKLALSHNDYRLSLLLAQAEGNTFVRQLLVKQLYNWKQYGVYEFIAYDRKVLYSLLAGMLVYEDVNCCENLNWKQSLALQLWYHCNTNSSVQEAVTEYEESFLGTSSNGKYSCPPFPSYLNDLIFDKTEENDPDMIFDVCYHILKLYCDRSYRFDLLLTPETYSSDHLDYRLCWLLHLALSSIGYNIPVDLSNTLHVNFASQLESLNLWHWAIFVILHHADDEWRAKQVKDILLRNVSIHHIEKTVERETFLIQNLHIPEKWIYEAKAIKANSLGKRAEEAWFLLKAGLWTKSHGIVIKYLASDAVINEDYDYLLKYLSELSVPERSSTILDWSSGGQVYLDYINMCRVVQEILSREASAYDLEKFTPEVVSLCKRLSTIPAYSLKDRLSIAEMAKKTATILQSISVLQASRTKNNSLLTMLASSIKNLPMPHDYAVPENRFVAHCFLEETTET